MKSLTTKLEFLRGVNFAGWGGSFLMANEKLPPHLPASKNPTRSCLSKIGLPWQK